MSFVQVERLDEPATIDAELALEPIIGNHYFCYERTDGTCFLSIVEPEYWGQRFELKFVMQVEYASIQSWIEINTSCKD
jgi:hypothetical protein